ncbi:hypothetical protein [Providencia burhodogranariea]|uniref:Uncharacterized protein n=1 Tax=Providencia burhodogranariea DSM 19968 TaxID=1141662 RepID=K8WCY6_9GAMM|nr:hypothetical protein [Providencia burhodogranariea]EKT54105.1 hypothetical protein OOA_17934 [Providencia burhodogranariea DSM 19968]
MDSKSTISKNLNNEVQNILNDEVNKGHLKFNYYHSRGRVAVIKKNSLLFNALNGNPNQSASSHAAFLMMNWLTGKPRTANNHTNNFLLSTVSTDVLSGNKLHPNQNLFIDSFDSPHQWDEDETRASQQLADALLPSGQWHRHYDTVVLSSQANNEQVRLVRHWMSLTGGSALILQEDNTSPSPAIKKLIKAITPKNHKDTQSTPIPIANVKQTKPGIAVYAYPTNHKPADIQSAYVMTLTHLQASQTTLPARQVDTVWIYDTIVKAPTKGRFAFSVDFSKIHNDIQLEVETQKLKIKKGERPTSITFKNLEAGQKSSLRITTTTDGLPPELKLLWVLPNTRTLSTIPKNALQYNSPLQNDIPITSASTKLASYKGMPLADVIKPIDLSQNIQQVVKLPSTAINQFRLTDNLAKEAEYFSITIKDNNRKQLLKLDDIPLSGQVSWDTLTKEVEQKINEQLKPLSHRISINYENRQMKIKGDGLTFTQFQLKKSHKITYVEGLNPVDTQQKQNITTHRISFEPEQLNCFTHISISLKDLYGRNIALNRSVFKSPKTQFSSPDEFARYLQHHLRHQSGDNSLSVAWDTLKQQLVFTDSLNRTHEKINFGYQDQILPFVIAENPQELPNTLTVGAVIGQLPQHSDIKAYRLLEKPKSGFVGLNHDTGEWRYRPNSHTPFTGFDQFDFVAVMEDGNESAPISVQVQTDNAPIVSYPGKRTFSMQDPIYHPPVACHYRAPSDMQVHDISLTQTHQQHLDSPYLRLVANRWALIKVDITSQTGANAPDIVAIVSDNQGHEIGRMQLTGPQQLPQQLAPLPAEPDVSGRIANKQSYTAPLKGNWIKPDIRIRLMADNRPIIQPYTDNNGFFSPAVNPENHLVTHVSNTSLYQKGHGIYAYSPFSWGKEAAAKLPVTKFTLYNSPSIESEPPLLGYTTPTLSHSSLTMPQYDKLDPLLNTGTKQIGWAYQQGEIYRKANASNNELHYMSIKPSVYRPLLGLGSPNYGGGLARPDVMWHEILGHGLGLKHTTDQGYPYSKDSNGPHVAYDQSRQSYITYRYSPRGQIEEIKPAMYPSAGEKNKAKFDAFIPHSAYYNYKIQRFLANQPRSSKVQNDVPVYWVGGNIITLPGGQTHAYSHLQVKRTIGKLPTLSLNSQSKFRRDMSQSYLLNAVYATENGLTPWQHAIDNINIISLNIPDKGELVRLEIISGDSTKSHDKPIYTYKNPDALANRLFSQWDKNTHLAPITLDNYWHGGKLFWSATDPLLVDFLTGVIDKDLLKEDSALCAKWVENGQLHQQYFALNEPWGKAKNVNTLQPFLPINYLTLQKDKHTTTLADYSVKSDYPLLSDTYINQTVDISALKLPTDKYSYWATLLVKDKQGQVQEQIPLEQWQITQQGNQLSVVGTIDSTPSLNIAGLKIYIDTHLQDEQPPISVTLMQQGSARVTENTKFLNYNNPVIFNTIEQQPELIASIKMPESGYIQQISTGSQTALNTFAAPLLV